MGRINPVVSLAALVALASAACGAARADDFPPRKPGLWQVEMAMPGGPDAAATDEDVHRSCDGC